jgi:hypothetical protein
MKKDVTRLLFFGVALLFAFSSARAQVSAPQELTSVIAQIVDGGAWATTIALTNTSANPTDVYLSFYQETGGGNTQSWGLNFVEMTSAQAGSLVLPAGSTLFLHTLGTAAATTVGYGEVSEPVGSGTPVVAAYAIFTQRIPGRPDQDGTAEATPPAVRILAPFDNTNGAVTSMAITNDSGYNTSVSVGIRTPASTVQPAAITLPPGGHMSFTLPTQFPETADQTGLAEFYSSLTSFSILALRFNSGAFTTAPVYSVTGPPIMIGSAP